MMKAWKALHCKGREERPQRARRNAERAAFSAFIIVVVMTAMCSGFAQSVSGVPLRRLANLRRGINTSHWFAQVYDPKGYTKEHFQTWTTADDIALIKAMGFDHVRLSVNPQPMFSDNHADEIPAEYLGYLDDAVKMILDHNLAVVIDIHPEGDFKAQLSHDDFVEQFSDYWRALARHYSRLDPDRVFFEILNEPEMQDRYRWYGVQLKLASSIREGAPQHTIIVAGAQWSNNDQLLFTEPLRDPNIVYNFHFYEPHIFTHQGATWGVNYWHFLKALPYPSSPESVQSATALEPDAVNRLAVVRYGLDRWNAERIASEITRVDEWAHQRGVPVVCNEFGVYRKNTDPKDRAAWINDVRTSLEKHGIGWTMWDYAGGFAVAPRTNGTAIADELTVKALGLKMPGAGK
jgi:aryl-phospho-beta-D-glucosidase BglC (GH1 family)